MEIAKENGKDVAKKTKAAERKMVNPIDLKYNDVYWVDRMLEEFLEIAQGLPITVAHRIVFIKSQTEHALREVIEPKRFEILKQFTKLDKDGNPKMKKTENGQTWDYKKKDGEKKAAEAIEAVTSVEEYKIDMPRLTREEFNSLNISVFKPGMMMPNQPRPVAPILDIVRVFENYLIEKKKK